MEIMEKLKCTLSLAQQIQKHLEKSISLTNEEGDKLEALGKFKARFEEAESAEEMIELLSDFGSKLEELKEVYEKVDSELNIAEVLLADPGWETNFSVIDLVHSQAVNEFLKVKTATQDQIDQLKNMSGIIEQVRNELLEED